MKNLLLLLLLAAGLWSCHNNDDPEDPAKNISLVTGIFLTDENGQSLGKAGNPNVVNDQVSVYPSLVYQQFHVIADQSVIRLWLATGAPDTTYSQVDFEDRLKDHQYAITEIQAIDKKEVHAHSDQFAVNVSDCPTGYYRVFFQMGNGSIQWDNIYIDNSQVGPAVLDKVLSDW